MGQFVLGWLAAKLTETANDESAGAVRDILKLKRDW